MVILVDAAGIRNPTGGYEVIPAGAIGFFSGIAVLEERWSIGDWARETVEDFEKPIHRYVYILLIL